MTDQPNGCFVHGLWGDHRISTFQQVLDEVRWCLEQPYQPLPMLWYAYGKDNAAFLRSLGVDAILMNDSGFAAFERAQEPESADRDEITRHGVSMWRMKYPMIRQALESYPACVWLDLDTQPTRPTPPDFWTRLADGACFQCTLQQNHKRRAGWRGDDNEPRKTPGGNWMYFRGLEPIDRMLRLYREHPDEWDLTVLARLIDELMGGTFQGSGAYKSLGYEPYCHTLGRHERRQVHTPEDRLFVTHWRKVGVRKMRKRKVTA